MGAYLAMLGATTSLDVPDGLPEDVSEAMAQMNEGDLQSVAWFGNAINQLRTRSMTDINALRDRISTLQGTVVDFKARIAKRERISLAFNVIGLLLVLLKDIPVWRTGRPTGGST